MDHKVRITHYALDETPEGTVLRGVLDPTCLEAIISDVYQREVLPQASRRNSLIKAMRGNARIPDIELGMRGCNFEFEGEKNETIVLLDPIFVIDGLQRIASAKDVLLEGKVIPHLGAVIHFNTTEDWERERFRTLNQDRIKLSPNILLRNMEQDNPAIALLLQMTKTDKAFVLNGRICWSQQMARVDLLTAYTFIKVVGRLHIHLGPTGTTQVDELARGINKTMDVVGKKKFRENVRHFFDVIDRMWGIKRVTYTRGAVYMRGTFLLALVKLFSNHTNFWKDDTQLVVDQSIVRKLATFPIDDPHVVQLSSSGGKASDMLYVLMVEHINSGKRIHRLNSRNYVPDSAEEVNEEEAVA